MKNLSFMVLAGLVAAIVAKFMSSPPGMESWVVLVGTVAALAGGGLGIPAHKATAGWKMLFVLVGVAIFVGSVIAYRSVLAGEPGSTAANLLLVWTSAMFVPVGFFIELAGLKVTSEGAG
ncbi:hypothetical protein ACVIJ6_002415 [Bradyrhizobium sp. USDA 4369]